MVNPLQTLLLSYYDSDYSARTACLRSVHRQGCCFLACTRCQPTPTLNSLILSVLDFLPLHPDTDKQGQSACFVFHSFTPFLGLTSPYIQGERVLSAEFESAAGVALVVRSADSGWNQPRRLSCPPQPLVVQDV